MPDKTLAKCNLMKLQITGKVLIIMFLTLVFPYQINAQEFITKELTLSEVIDIGLNHNQEIRGAKEKVSASKGRYWSSISLPAPEVSLSYEYIPVNTGIKNFSESTFEVKQSFEFPTNYVLRSTKQNNEIESANYGVKQTEIAIISNIKTAYYKVLAKEKQVGLAKDNLVIAEDFAKKAEIRLNVGEGTNLEKLTAKVQYTEALNNMDIARNEVKNAYAELNFILGFGKYTSSVTALKDSLYFKEYIFSQDHLVDIALSSNQQIKLAELNLNTSLTDKRLAWSSVLPGFNLSYFRQTRDGDKGFYGASFGVTIPFWFMFEHRGNIQEAAANTNIVESELDLTKNNVFLKIKNDFNEYENNLKQVKLYLSDILPQAEEVYRTAFSSYEAGEITYIEFLQARQTLISAKNNYINILFNYYRSIFSLEETAGQSLTNVN